MIKSLSTRMKSGSSRDGGEGVARKHSLMGELLRGTAPPWVENLVDAGLSSSDEKKLAALASECGLCKCSLKTAKDMEPANKKVCRCCKLVVCRQCAAHVHILGHVRRRYVCFKCVGKACTQTELVAPKIVVKTEVVESQAPRDSVAVDPDEQEEQKESILTSFVSRLWDTWAGSAQNDELLSDDENDDSRSVATTQPAQSVANEEEAGEDKMARMNELLDGADGKFNGEQLKNLLEVSHGFKGDSTLVLNVPFTKACLEVIKLMAGLGKAFEFAGSDMNDKLRIMEKRCKETAKEASIPVEEVTIQMMVEREVKLGTTHAGKKAQGATRTAVRLLWFLDFIGVLMKKLADEPKTDLSKILSATYEETLAPRHIWVLRRMVRSGMSMVPDKKHFIPKLGVEGLSEQEQCAKFREWGSVVDTVRQDLWKFMESKGCSEVP